jgi:hypothetical protein
VVSFITEGSGTDDRGRPYKRRRPLPIAALILVCAFVAAATWVAVFATDKGSSTEAAPCNPPSSEPAEGAVPLGNKVEAETIDEVPPASLAATQVRVYNANGEAGQAADVAAQLAEYGFAPAVDVQAGNDPVYTDQNLECQGQLRFGPNGKAQAGALRLVAPCAELVQDERTDATVDLALGTYFRKMNPGTDAQELLRTLRTIPVGAEVPPLDADLLATARSAHC